MRITELLQDATIDLGVKVNSKEEAIDHLVDLMVKGGNITDREEYKKGILAREANGTTGIGGGIAIPHSKNKAVTKAGLASMTVPDGVDYEAMDGEPSDVFFMIAAPAEGSDVHLEALSRLSVILMDPVFKDSLLKATSKEEYLALIDKKETEKFPEEAAKEEEKPAVQEEKADDGTIRVLAVTACPTGIAHTFMAAESLENKAKEMGITLKAETNGSGGAKNVLTKEEIENCDGIIVAADKNVEMARFDDNIKVVIVSGSGDKALASGADIQEIHDRETLKMLEGYIDIYLPDFKYSDNKLAKRLSKVDNYFEITTEALSLIFVRIVLTTSSLARRSIPFNGSSSRYSSAFLDKVTAIFSFAIIPEDKFLTFIFISRSISAISFSNCCASKSSKKS